MHRRFISVFRLGIFILLIVGMIFQPQYPAKAAPTLSITPLTWNIIGLDSNTPTSGPYLFPVGAHVCSAGATNVTVKFNWGDSNDPYTGDPYINLRAGTNSSIALAFTGAGCQDAYFEIQVTKVAAAYNKTRRYYITAENPGGIDRVSTPTPRELLVEHLISQNRNAVTDVKFGTSLASLTSVAAGGAMTLMVGNTYYIQLYGGTATQGYNQFEAFINFPNTIFQILSVNTTYSADSNTGHVPNPNPALYANACTWDNDPNSPTYRSCIGGDDKAGGSNVVTTYQVKIISGGGTSQTLNTLLYDFSGSSYHYNADFSTSARIAYIVDPSVVTISKSFSPKAIAPGGTSTMTIKLTNPTTLAMAGLTFTDAFPSGMTLANTTTTNTCGGSLANNSGGALNAGDPGIKLNSGTLAANSVCTITVNVTAPAGTYNNTTGHLFINDTTDTGNYGTDTLTASSAPACALGQIAAQWTIPSTSTNPPDTAGGIPTTLGANVSSATASFSSTNGGGSSIYGSSGQNDTYSWESWGWKTAGSQILFKVDTSNYSANSVSFYALHDSAGPTSLTMEYSTNNGASYSGTTTSAVNATFNTLYTLSIPQNNTVWVKITASGANNDNSGADLYIDNVTFTGCSVPAPAPTILKSFSPNPIIKGSTSTLSFTLNNTASGNRALTGVAFTDVLPAGLSVTSSSTSQCGGTLTTTAATRTVALTGGSLAAGGSCTFSVTVTGTTEGQYDNVTGYVSSTQSGTSTNYATASLVVIAPPVLAKSFSPASIFTGSASTLAFTVKNPNLNNALNGISFNDTLPAGLAVTTSGPTATCGGSLTTTAPSTISFTGGSLLANNSCTFNVTVTGTVAGTISNTTTAVTSTEGGTGNTASASLIIADQIASIDLTKQVSTTGTDPWSTFIGVTGGSSVYYRFKVYNSGDLPFSAISVSDPTLASTVANPAACNWSAYLPLAPGGTGYCVTGPIAASSTPGSYPNTATAHGTYATGTKDSLTSTATYATPQLTITKNATEGYFTAAGNVLHYSFNVTNSGFVPLLGPVTVADDKAIDENCPAVNTVGDKDDYLDPGETITCTATYTVTAADVTARSVTNTVSATISGVVSNNATKTVILAALTIDKDTTTPSVDINGNVVYNIVIVNTGQVTLTNFQVSDVLPVFGGTSAVLSVTAPGYTVNGSYSGIAPNTNLLAGTDTLAVSATATVTITVHLNNATVGTYDNTATATTTQTGSIDDDGLVAGDPGTPSLAADPETDEDVTVYVQPDLTVTKTNNALNGSVASGGTFQWTITASNGATAGTASFANGDMILSDTLPAGQTYGAVTITNGATAPTGTINCSITGTALSCVANGPVTMPAKASFRATFNVTTVGNANLSNTASVDPANKVAESNETNNTGSNTVYLFDATPSKLLVITSEPSTAVAAGAERVTIGEMVRYRLISRIPEGSFTNVQLVDGLQPGLQFLNDNTAKVAFVCNSGVTCMTSTTLSGAGLVINGASSNVSPTVVVPGTAISGAPFGSGTDVTFSLGNITNSDSNADAEFVVVEFNALVLNVNASPTINQGTNNQTAVDVPNNRQNDVDLHVNGSTVGSSSPNVTVDIAEPAITSFTKSVSPATGPYLPGQALTYTLTFSNTTLGNNNAATAFDVVLSDTFDSNLTLGTINVSSMQGATCVGGTAFATSNSTSGQLVTVNVSCLDPGKSVIVTVNATINNTTSSGTNIANSSSLIYTSLPGAQGNCAAAPFTCTGIGTSGSGTGERNGSGGHGADATILNNYAFTSNTVNTPVTYGSITIVLDSLPNDAQDFGFTGSGPNGYNFGGGFSLDDDADGTLPNTRTFISLVPGTYTLTQGTVNGWSLTGLTCVDPDNGSTVNLGTATATIDLDAGENIVCTYTNTQWLPSLVLTKIPTLDESVVAPNNVSNPGDTITYTFSVQNTGNVTVSNITVSDPLLPGLSCTIASLAAGATSSCTATNNVYTLTQADIDAGSRTNTATATGKDPGNNDVTDSDTKNTSLTQAASIVLTKTPVLNDAVVLPGNVVNVGDTITYAYSVENTGNVVVSNITVNDPLLPTLSCSIASLAPGAIASCTATNNIYVLTQSDIDAGSRANTATATGKDPGNNDVTDTDTRTTSLTRTPSISLIKSGTLNDNDGTPGLSAGDTISYAFTVTNSGNTTLTNVSLADTVGGVTINGGPILSLAPGISDTTTFTGTYTITQADIDAGTFTNTATVTGTPPTGPNVTASDEDTQTLTGVPALTIAKTLDSNADEDGSGNVSLNDTLAYSVTVTNAGNTTLTNVVVNDTLITPNTTTCSTLLPNATCVLTGTYVVTQTDVNNGQINNTGSVTDNNVCPAAGTGTCQDSTSVNIAQNPALTIAKSVTETSYAAVGDILHYSYLVTNSGNVILDGPFTVTDDKSADEICPATATLNPGASITCSATYTITQADLNTGSVINIASAHGSFAGNAVNSPTDTVTVGALQKPSLSIVKSVTETSYANVGDVLHYSYLVTSTGNVTLDGPFTVTDDKSTDETCPSTATLAVGTSITCTATYTIGAGDMTNGSVTNVASAHGFFSGNPVDSVTDTKTVTLAAAPSIVLTKTPTLDDTVVAPSGVANVGDTIAYTFSVQNTGNVTVTNISIADPLLPTLSCTIASLAPGATASCTPSNNVYPLSQADINAGSRSNTATATGKDSKNNDVIDSDTKTTSLNKAPFLKIVKEASTDNSTWNDTSVSVSVGDTVYYRVRVSNTGNTTLTGLTVDDGMTACALTRDTDIIGNNDNSFEAGEEWVYTCSVTAVLGTNNNTATADTNETSSVSDTASYVAGAASVADPALTKSGNPTQASVGDTVTFTLTVSNKGTASASNVVVTDALPSIFDVTAVNVTGAPLGTVVNVTPLIGTGSAPYTVVVTLGGDLTATDVVMIQIVTKVNSAGNPPINNTASLTTSAATDIVSNDSASVEINVRKPVHRLPATGFAKGTKTILGPQPSDLKYASTDVLLEIPSLGVKIPIVGVPQKDGTWNISWLENQAGWLQGTAFPSWSGNSVLTGHVYMATGLPGPFVNLNKLKYGDKIIVHAYGQKYTFEVQTNVIVSPDDQSVMKHEAKSWVTLVTCRDYDEKTKTYLSRVIVRAVLVRVDWE